MKAQDIIEKLELLRHPETGHFKETYRAEGKININGSLRNYSTAVYFLLEDGEKSNLHKIASDEIWHFYLGDPLEIIQISPEGELEIIKLGSNIMSGQKLQHAVPAGYWFGSYSTGQYSFVGCTVSPGFDFEDFALANRQELVAKHPQHKNYIEKLTDD